MYQLVLFRKEISSVLQLPSSVHFKSIYVSYLPPVEQQKTLISNKDDSHLEVLLQFIAGLHFSASVIVDLFRYVPSAQCLHFEKYQSFNRFLI